jgi:ubiquinone/menaquinone biosynthesis C-methylase UbiE
MSLHTAPVIDPAALDAKVQDMYRAVARDEHDDLHFAVGRPVAERLGYPADVLDAIPDEALGAFAGVGYHLDLAALEPGDAVLDLGSGSGTDVFAAAVAVGSRGRVTGVDFTAEQRERAAAVRDRHGFGQVELVDAWIDDLPFADGAFDAVISNGVINLALAKDWVFGEAARVLRPGGRLALSDIVTGKPIKERTRRKVDLWAACIAGAIPRTDYLAAIERAGFTVEAVRKNPYEFTSPRAANACVTYEVESVSLLARRT